MSADSRGRKVAFVAHCLLNQNAKVAGLAGYRGVVEPVVSLLIRSGVGIIQMPCPEMVHLGPGRPVGTDTVDQYDTPDYRAVCQRIARQVSADLSAYQRGGISVLCVLGVEGSPSCSTTNVPRLVSGGQRVLVPGRGLFMQALVTALDHAELVVPVIGIPETSEAGSLNDAMSLLNHIVSASG